MYGAISFMLLLPIELGEDVVQRAGGASFALTLGAAVAFTQVVGADEWVVDECLEDHRHEAGLAHVVETAQSSRRAWYCAGVSSYQTLVTGLCEDGVFALARHAGGTDGLKGRIVHKVPAFVAEDVSVFRLDGCVCWLVKAVACPSKLLTECVVLAMSFSVRAHGRTL